MKTNAFFKSALAVCALPLFFSCSQEDLAEAGSDAKRAMVVKVTENGFSAVSDTDSRVIDEGYATVFEDKDQIGLFIIENETGKLLQNMTLTKNGSNWEGTVYYYDNADYIAYYPYDAELKDVASVEDIEKYFSDNKYTDDQSTEANYRNCDLMTAVVEAERLTEESSSLNLNFTHNNALVEFNIPYYSYSTEANGAGYRYSVPVDLTLNLGESTTFKPYQVAVGKYRVIVPAGKEVSFKGNFMDAESDKPVYIAATIPAADLAKNAGRVYNVEYEDSPEVGEVVQRAIQPGDYYYADGNIVPKEFAAVPKDNCIGVVFATTTNNEKALDGTTTCSNGYVMALVDATESETVTSAWAYKWGNDNISIEGLDIVNVGNDLDDLSSVITKNDVSGWVSTKLIVEADKYADADDYIKNAVVEFGAADKSTSKYAAPKNTTGWFIPAAYQFTQIVKNLGADEAGKFDESETTTVSDYNGTQKILTETAFTRINDILFKAGGVIATGTKSYWTSSVASYTTTDEPTTTYAPVYFNNAVASGKLKGNFVAKDFPANDNNSNKRNVRLILAF